MKNPFHFFFPPSPPPPTREEILTAGLERLEQEKLAALSALLEADSALDLIRRKLGAFSHELHLLRGTAIPPKQEFPDIPH